MAETETANGVKENKLWKGVFAVSGIMSTLVIYGVLQVCVVFYVLWNLVKSL